MSMTRHQSSRGPNSSIPDLSRNVGGRVAAFFKRLGEVAAQLDYGPYDYVEDRLSAVERRLRSLEDELFRLRGVRPPSG